MFPGGEKGLVGRQAGKDQGNRDPAVADKEPDGPRSKHQWRSGSQGASIAEYEAAPSRADYPGRHQRPGCEAEV